jgi:hypothetical protein
MREAKKNIPAAAAIAKTDKNIVLLVAKLNAAPVLKSNSNLRKSPIKLIGSSANTFTAANLVK